MPANNLRKSDTVVKQQGQSCKAHTRLPVQVVQRQLAGSHFLFDVRGQRHFVFTHLTSNRGLIHIYDHYL